MTDQCKNCVVSGDMPKCLETECSHHDSWFAVELLKKIERQDKELEQFRVLARIVLGESTGLLKHWDYAIEYGFIDENGNPTKLLTGEK